MTEFTKVRKAVHHTEFVQIARKLADATDSGQAIPQVAEQADLDLTDAYAVQHAGISLRKDRGENTVGVKLGFTSRAKAEQMGVSDIIIGTLTSSMGVSNGGEIDLTRGVHPRIEPEVAFLFGHPAGGQNDPDTTPVVTHIAPALEVIDSRFEAFKFSLEDVVADNTSASAFVIGNWVPVEKVEGRLDLSKQPVFLFEDDDVIAEGTTADILGNPWEAIAAAQRMSATYGHEITAGSILLAGAATPAAPITVGHSYRAMVYGLGTVSVRTGDARSHG